MSIVKGITGLVREHVLSLNPYADIILLFPQGKAIHEDIQIFVLLPEKVDYSIEQQYLNASYNVELESGQSLSVYIYDKENWHKQFKNTPIYQRVQNEGLVL